MGRDVESSQARPVDLRVVAFGGALLLVDAETGRAVPLRSISVEQSVEDQWEVHVQCELQMPCIEDVPEDWQPGVPLIPPVEREKEVL